MPKYFLQLIFIFLLSSPYYLSAAEVDLIINPFQEDLEVVQETPWSADQDNPVLPEISPQNSMDYPENNSEGIVKSIFSGGIVFFQKIISPVDGDRCSMYPTCSAYGLEALNKYGAAIGLMMTVDRLIHELEEQEIAPLIVKFGQYRFYDPIENNNFWWSDPLRNSID